MLAAPNADNGERPVRWVAWFPVLGGLLLLYGPTFYELSEWHWRSEEGGHGPIILAIIAWLVWRRRNALLIGSTPKSVLGYSLMTLGLSLYVLGRSQQVALFEVGALLPLISGVLLAMRGVAALRTLWFPVLFVLFLVPVPESLLDSFTGPLKQQVSMAAEGLLYAAGYPVARTGVVLTIGQYQLLVADACSGVQSMISLSALGLLYMYLAGRVRPLHNALMLASILPIAFAANIVRVVVLMLITFHFGDAAGQGFMHGATGILLLLVALACLVALDTLLASAFKQRSSAQQNA